MNKRRFRTRISLGLAFVCGSALLLACNYQAAVTPTPERPNPPAGTSASTQTPAIVFPESSVISPDGLHAARIDGGDRLVIIDSGGGEAEIAGSGEITRFLWFPDSRHLVYTDRVSTGAGFPSTEDRLWIADIVSGTPSEIDKGFAPNVSPNGNRVAFLLGARVGDACLVGFGLGVVELDDQTRPVSLLRQEEISGFPISEEAETFYPALGKDLEFPGIWRDASTLEVQMRWACKTDDPGNGVYLVDLESMRAEKIGELPAE